MTRNSIFIYVMVAINIIFPAAMLCFGRFLGFKYGEITSILAPIYEIQGFAVLTYFEGLFFRSAALKITKLFSQEAVNIIKFGRQIGAASVIFGCLLWVISVVISHYKI